MSLTLKETQRNSKIEYFDDTVFIDLLGNQELRVMFSIDTSLLEYLFKTFFTHDVSDVEKIELIEALPLEIANIVVGLAKQHFAQEHGDLGLSVPYRFDDDNMREVISHEHTESCTIATINGRIICLVTALKKRN
jgi:hypothetical protein